MTEPVILKTYLEKNGLLKDNTIQLFEKYRELIEQTNKVMNLTAIFSFEDYQIKHFIDSLLGYEFIKDAKTVCDIGSGAGFPALPLAIVLENVNFCMVDSLNKRVNFLNSVIQELSLKNCSAIHSRAEDFAKKAREKYDVCTARAVAPLNILLEYTAPLAKVGGFIVAYKGSNAKEEAQQAENASKILGCKLVCIKDFVLPNGDARSIIVYKKIKPCDKKYPRGGNKPRLNPLV